MEFGRVLENRAARIGMYFLTGSLALAGCAGGKGEGNREGTHADKSPVSVPATPGDRLPTLVFDDLGGGSSIIMVYPGVTESAEDRKWNGTFEDGNKVLAECKTVGREVQSDTTVGEQDRTSKDWVRIHGTPGETQYATAVYVENPAALLAQLPDC